MVNILSLTYVLIGAFLGGVGSLVIKKGINCCPFWDLWKTRYLWGGLFLYMFATFFYVLALKGELLTVVYPFVSTTYIWATFFSTKFLKEKMNCWKWIGLVGIVIGVVLIGLGS